MNYIVSEAELKAVKAAHADVYEMEEHGSPADIEDSLEELGKAEAACRARPVDGEAYQGVVKICHELNMRNEKLEVVAEAAKNHINADANDTYLLLMDALSNLDK